MKRKCCAGCIRHHTKKSTCHKLHAIKWMKRWVKIKGFYHFFELFERKKEDQFFGYNDAVCGFWSNLDGFESNFWLFLLSCKRDYPNGNYTIVYTVMIIRWIFCTVFAGFATVPIFLCIFGFCFCCNREIKVSAIGKRFVKQIWKSGIYLSLVIVLMSLFLQLNLFAYLLFNDSR